MILLTFFPMFLISVLNWRCEWILIIKLRCCVLKKKWKRVIGQKIRNPNPSIKRNLIKLRLVDIVNTPQWTWYRIRSEHYTSVSVYITLSLIKTLLWFLLYKTKWWNTALTVLYEPYPIWLDFHQRRSFMIYWNMNSNLIRETLYFSQGL